MKGPQVSHLLALAGGALGVLAAGAVFAACFGRVSSGLAGAGGQCRLNADCPGGQACVSGICKTGGTAHLGQTCEATRDCASGLFCGTFGVCEMGGTLAAGQACTIDAQCLPPLRCNLDGFFGSCGPGGTGEPGRACQATADCLAGLYCGRGDICTLLGTAFPPYEGATCQDEGVFRAYFEVPRPGHPPADFFRLPFPNDVRVSDSGVLDIGDFPTPGSTPLGVDVVQLYVDAWTADFDGFSGIGPVTFRFSKEIQFDTATPESVLLVDLTPGPSLGRGFARTWVSFPDRSKYACANRLVVRNVPGTPLEPRHTYAVILTTAIRSTDGEAPAIDPDLAAALAATRPTDGSLAHAWDAYAPLRAWRAGQGAAAPEVAAAAVFTVGDTTGHMQRLAAAVAAAPAPMLGGLSLCGSGTPSPCDAGEPDRACGPASATTDEIHGTFRVPIFQAGTAPYETPAMGGEIDEDATSGAPMAVGTEDVCFALVVPKATSAAPMPAAGWPLVVYGHGTGGSMRSAITDGVAGALGAGASPAAVLGFDEVEHGPRRGASTRSPDELVFNPLNPRAARDNVLQGAADVLQALRIAGLTVTLPGAAAGITFDATKVGYFGHSQGSTSGELALAFSGAAQAAALSGAGAFLTQSLLHKQSPRDVGAGLSFLVGEPLDADHPVMMLFQSFFDRSDPLHYAPLLVRAPPSTIPAKHLYMSWGTGDTFSPEATLAANALALGLPPVVPVLEDFGVASITRPVSLNLTLPGGAQRTGAVFQYAPAGYDGHFVATRNDAAIADWTAFFAATFATGTPAIP